MSAILQIFQLLAAPTVGADPKSAEGRRRLSTDLARTSDGALKANEKYQEVHCPGSYRKSVTEQGLNPESSKSQTGTRTLDHHLPLADRSKNSTEQPRSRKPEECVALPRMTGGYTHVPAPEPLVNTIQHHPPTRNSRLRLPYTWTQVLHEELLRGILLLQLWPNNLRRFHLLSNFLCKAEGRTREDHLPAPSQEIPSSALMLKKSHTEQSSMSHRDLYPCMASLFPTLHMTSMPILCARSQLWRPGKDILPKMKTDGFSLWFGLITSEYVFALYEHSTLHWAEWAEAWFILWGNKGITLPIVTWFRAKLMGVILLQHISALQLC